MSETTGEHQLNYEPVLTVTNLTKHYQVGSRFSGGIKQVQALRGVSFVLEKRKTLAIVGESGCGKSTLAKALMSLETPTSGSFDLGSLVKNQGKLSTRDRLAAQRRYIQMIFQDPYSSLNPRKKAWQIIAEPIIINNDKNLTKPEIKKLAIELMGKVGLRSEFAERYPHMFSGGQRQRIGIARALGLHPQILICDEPVSALDVSIQSQVLNLLIELQESLNLSLIFISHDLGVVRFIADEVIVMYLGRVVEKAPVKTLFENPSHPYTQALLASAPKLGILKPKTPDANISSAVIQEHPHGAPQTTISSILGELPSPFVILPGCSFAPRCPRATALCSSAQPELITITGPTPNVHTHEVACHHTNG